MTGPASRDRSCERAAKPRGRARPKNVAPLSSVTFRGSRLFSLSPATLLTSCPRHGAPLPEAARGSTPSSFEAHRASPEHRSIRQRLTTAPPLRATDPGFSGARFPSVLVEPSGSLPLDSHPRLARVVAPGASRSSSWPRSLSLSDPTRKPRSYGRRPHNQALQQTGTRLLLGASRRQARASS